ncbi:MAG TPA: hypothetical protein VGN27_01725 [Gaiellaceae bacterium]|jgi:hypothetical protein|nr:hypothetical protein [Gaiellaceae bacterium]
MRRYGLYDVTRGLTTAVAAAAAGLLLWAATQVGQQTTGRFWAEMGIVAAAGFVLSIAHALGGWTKGLRLRLSPSTFLLGFIPVLVCVGWILMTAQPGSGWHEGRIVSWSQSLGIVGAVHALGLWNGVLALALGLVLGLTVDSVAAPDPEPVVAVDRTAADEPVAREREAAASAEPHTVVVGPRHDTADTTTTAAH